jgi:hypothetical protein
MSAEEREQDFGEEGIAPEMQETSIEGLVPPRADRDAPQCPQAEQIESYRFDPVDEESLSARVQPRQAAAYDAEERRLRRAERERDDAIVQDRRQAELDIESRHNEAHAEQLNIRAEAKREVALQKRLWSDSDRALLQAYEGEARAEGGLADREVRDHRRQQQGEIERRRQGVQTQAREEEAATEQRVAVIKQEGQRSPAAGSRGPDAG